MDETGSTGFSGKTATPQSGRVRYPAREGAPGQLSAPGLGGSGSGGSARPGRRRVTAS